MTDIVAEAEWLELEGEIEKIRRDRANEKMRREARQAGKRGKSAMVNRMPGIPYGYELEWAEGP